MKRNRLSAAVGVLVSLAIGAGTFFGTLKIADVQAQRQGYVEKRVVSTGTATGLSAFANQLAPDPVTGMCLQADASNRSVWGPCGNLPSGGTPGQVLGVVALTATRTVVVTGSQTSIGTQTYTYESITTNTAMGTQTNTNGTATATATATGTSTSITTVATVSTGAAPFGLAYANEQLFVAAYNANELQVYDSEDPNLAYITHGDVTGNPRDVVMNSNGSYAYVPTAGNALKVVYVNTMGVVGTVNLTSGCGPRMVVRYGNDLFVSCALVDKIDIVNVADPNAPALRTPISTEDDPRALALSSNGQYLFVAAYTGNNFSIYDVSNPASPSHVKTITTETGPYGLAASGSYVFVSAFNADKIQAVDVSTPASASVVGAVSTSSKPYRLAVYGNYVFVTAYNAAKLEAYNFASPSSPSGPVGYVTTATNPYALIIVGDKAYVTSYGENKLQKFSLANYTPREVTTTTSAIGTGTYAYTFTGTIASTGTQTVAGTSAFTSNATGVGTGTGVEWKAVNGTIYAGQNIRLTKGTDTETNTAVDMMDKPTVNLYGISVSNGVLAKGTSDGLGDSCVTEGALSLDSSKTIRATGATTPASGAGAELAYTSGVAYLISRNQGASELTPLSLAASGVYFNVGGVYTMKAPTTAGTEGQLLAKGPDNASVWTTPNIPGGDLFLYAAGNRIAFWTVPQPTVTGEGVYITASTTPHYFNYPGNLEQTTPYTISIANANPSTSSLWISSGVISYSVSLKATASVTTRMVLGVCHTTGTSMDSVVGDVSISVTSSSWTVFTGSISLPSGLLIPADHLLCMHCSTWTSGGTADSYLGMTYDYPTKFNGPWIKSGANAW